MTIAVFAYPSAADAATSFAALVEKTRSGNLFQDLPADAKHIWVCQGFMQSLAMGDGALGKSAVGIRSTAVDDLKALEIASVQLSGLALGGGPAAVSTLPIPWPQVRAFVKRLVLELMDHLLS